MVSRRDKQQAAIRLKVMRLISVNPEISKRQVADEVRVPNGSAYYVPTALVEKGFVKSGIFRNNPRKGQCAYLLTPKGIREKSLLTHSFVKCNRQKFEGLGAEIQAIECVVGLASEAIPASRGGK